MADLRRGIVFLSASFPSGARGKAYKPYDASGIADAVTALARGVLGGNGQLLFGGHPTITPLVLMIARELQVKRSVTVYQSSWFESQLLPEVQELAEEDLGHIVWTERKYTCQDSIESMRDTMIRSSGRWLAALFVGGMDGIQDEFHRVKACAPTIPCLPVAGPGGAAANLPRQDSVSLGLPELNTSRAYPFLALRVVDAIAKRTKADGIGS